MNRRAPFWGIGHQDDRSAKPVTLMETFRPLVVTVGMLDTALEIGQDRIVCVAKCLLGEEFVVNLV